MEQHANIEQNMALPARFTAPMRRAQQELSCEEIDSILAQATSGVLALAGNDMQPYAVPLSFAYEDGVLYFHGATAGLKLDLIRENARASFCVINQDDPLGAEFATNYASVVAFGSIGEITDHLEHVHALEALGRKYAPGKKAARQSKITESSHATLTFRLVPTLITGKCASQAVQDRARDLAVTPAVHKSMQGNKRANTKPELLMRERLRQAGLTGYRLQWKVPGRPDIAWPGKKVALFVNGCYWHRCPHCKPSMPKKNVEYWVVKFEKNQARDAQSIAQLEALGWRVHVVWECQLKKNAIEETMAKLLPQLADELSKP